MASERLNSPWDIDVENDGSGDVYVAVVDQTNNRVLLYEDTEATSVGGTTAPVYSTSFGAEDNLLGFYAQPEAVDLVDNGTVFDIYVADGARNKVVKYEAAPVPTITLLFTGGSSLPNSFPPASSYTISYTTQNAPDGSWVDFYFDTVGTLDTATAGLCITAGTITPTAGTAVWSFRNSPGGTPADGSYYLYAVLRDATGGIVASDAALSTELLTIDSKLTTALTLRDQFDGDPTLLMQNNLERTVEMQLVYPDSVIGASFSGTFPAETMEIVGIAPGDAWSGTGYTDLVFNSTYDNTAGTYMITASVTGAPVGLNGPGPYVVAHVRMQAKSDAVTEDVRFQSGEMGFDVSLSDITDINGNEPTEWRLNELAAKVAYLGDIANTSTGTDSVVPYQQPNPDGLINFADQIAFTLGWNGDGGVQDPIANIGPAIGISPDLLPTSDSSWDVDDLLSFSGQFSWFASKGYTGSQSKGSGWNSSFMPLGEMVESAVHVGVVTEMTSDVEPLQIVEVVVSGVENLMGAMVRLSYDERLMEFVGAEDGGFLSRGGGYVMFHTVEGAGRVEVDASRFHREQPGVSGEGTVARFHFRVLEGDAAPVSLAYDLRDVCNRVVARDERDLGSVSAGPKQLVLYQNAPNPVRPDTRITYALPEAGKIRLAVYDVRGRLVRTLSEGRQEAGFHTVVWDGRGERGAPVASGVYFYRLDMGQTSRTCKLLVTR